MSTPSVLRARLTFAFAITAATPAGAHAQDPDRVRVVTLDEARALAKQNRPRLAAARAPRRAAHADAEVPGANWYPRVGAMAQLVLSTANNSTTTLLGTATVALPRIGSTAIDDSPSLRPYGSTAAAIGATQQLADFGRTAAETRVLELIAELEDEQAIGVELDVDLEVQRTYYAALTATAIETAARGARERAITHRELAAANARSGLRPRVELTRADADVARYEAKLVQATANAKIARAMLATAVGSDLAELATSDVALDETPPPPLADVLARVTRTPEVTIGRGRVAAQHAETERLATKTRPEVDATAELSLRNGGAPPSSGIEPFGDGWLPTVPNYSIGVVVTWPLFDAVWSRRQAASREREQALAFTADEIERTQRGKIIAAHAAATTAAQVMPALEQSAAAAKVNYEQAEDRFRSGLGTSTEVADAQAVWTSADIDLAVGRLDLAIARAQLARASAVTP